MSKKQNRIPAEEAAVKVSADAQFHTNKKSEWYEVDGITFRFKRVAAFLYATASQQLEKYLTNLEPEVPIATKGSRSMENPKHPDYLRDMRKWEAESVLQRRDLQNVVTILQGVELRDPVPPTDEWLDDVKGMLAVLGISWEEYRESYTRLEEEIFLQYIYKKYIVLDSDRAIMLYAKFHRRNLELDRNSFDAANAASMFRSET